MAKSVSPDDVDRVLPRSNDSHRSAFVVGVVRFVDFPPIEARQFLVSVAEDTAVAVELARSMLLPAVSAGEAIALDFADREVLSQGYLHALLYTVIRVAWATRTSVYVVAASTMVRLGIEWLERYALAG